MSEDIKTQEESMEDILSSIRETVEEEVAKSSEGDDAVSADDVNVDDLVEEAGEATEKAEETDSDDLDVDALMAEVESETPAVEESKEDSSDDIDVDALMSETDIPTNEGVETTNDTDIETESAMSEFQPSENDVLELTDVVEPSSDKDEDLIDVNAFAETGEIVSAQSGETELENSEDVDSEESTPDVTTDTDDGFDIDLDDLMDEVSSDIEDVDANLSEDDAASMLVESNVPEESSEPEAQVEEDLIQEDVLAEKVEEAVMEQVAPTETVGQPAQNVHLPTTPSPTGLQVSFPAEILAEALRPLVKDWIDANLANVVERLVKEEISKLADK